MTTFRLVTPVAFIIFNRPDATERVFAEIANAKPTKLLVVGDGARTSQHGEAERVAATRAIVQRVDWDCEVLTNFSDSNLGCRARVSSGIDWVFENVEEAIILEDDCLPDQTFFRFCQEMLQHYRHDQRVGTISGDNFQFGRRYGNESYYFSKFVHLWGWASWRDRWAGSYDVDMTQWPRLRDEGRLVDIVGNKREAAYWGIIFDRVYRGEIDTWDYQWVFANWLEGRVSIHPSVNLISNIGFGREASHTTGSSALSNLPVTPIRFPLSHPLGMFKSIQADRIVEKQFFRLSLLKRIRNRVAGLYIQSESS
jgi:hypothetical protein